ncbi:MAG: hypothetical protein M1826_003430 [Phylliscum demangeonii]|nr:MAG: hypothetical protein M1826_003430 [Phylliscum demangeonii]
MASPARSVPDTSLGLSRDEILLLRQHQPAALALAQAQASQAATSSSRGASAASSQGGGAGGRLLLDPHSLQALAHHFDRLMQAIQRRMQMVGFRLPRGPVTRTMMMTIRWQLNQQTQLSTQAQASSALHAIEMADAEIARFHDILRQIDELEREFDKVRHIRDIVRAFKARVDALDHRV